MEIIKFNEYKIKKESEKKMEEDEYWFDLELEFVHEKTIQSNNDWFTDWVKKEYIYGYVSKKDKKWLEEEILLITDCQIQSSGDLLKDVSTVVNYEI